MSKAAWYWTLDRRDWIDLGDGVVITRSGEPQPRQLSWAAVLHAGRGARLSGDAGLVELGVKPLRVTVHSTVGTAGSGSVWRSTARTRWR